MSQYNDYGFMNFVVTRKGDGEETVNSYNDLLTTLFLSLCVSVLVYTCVRVCVSVIGSVFLCVCRFVCLPASVLECEYTSFNTALVKSHIRG